MSVILYVELNVLAIAVLLLMYFNLRKKQSEKMLFDQKMFGILILTNIGGLIFDTGMWMIDGTQFPFSRELNLIITTIYYFFNPLICFFWTIYNDYKLNEDKKRLLKKLKFYCIPLLICTVLILSSPWTGWIFSIDKANVYHRENLYWLIVLLSFVYLLYGMFLASRAQLRKQTSLENVESKYLFYFPITPIVAAIVQSLFYGLSLIWMATMFSLLIIFINIQNNQISIDYLTGLYNRRQLENHLVKKIRLVHSLKERLFTIVIDVDKFKSINDTYGHGYGDEILIKVADILRKSCCGKGDFLARLGGDEFIIVGSRCDQDEVKEFLLCIDQNIEALNQKEDKNISLSMGYSIFGEDGADDLEALIQVADKRMYDNKLKKKGL